MIKNRLLSAAVLAAAVTALLYWGMSALIKQDTRLGFEERAPLDLNFTRVPKEEETHIKDRIKKPERTPVKQPPNVKPLQLDQPTPPDRIMAIETRTVLTGTGPEVIGLPNLPGDGSGQASGELICIVCIAPLYPRKALIAKIEGWVKVQFEVTPSGAVINPKVIDAKPARLFNQAALNAISKFKFKPKVVNGQAVSQIATQTIEFELPKQ